MSKRWIRYLAAGALICVLIFLVILVGTDKALTILALPFILIGKGLRTLSLSGSIGNIAAIALYILISLSPMLLKLKRKWHKEDWLLPLMCATIFYVLYYMINPGLSSWFSSGSGSDIGNVIYVDAIYSVIISWGVIKLLRCCDGMSESSIYRAMRILLIICAAACIIVGFGIGFNNFLSDIAEIRESNTAPGLNLIPTFIFEFLEFAATALEYSLDAVVMMFGVALLRALEKDPYSNKCYIAAERTAEWCKLAMIIIMLTGTALNLGQVIFASNLYNIKVSLQIPILSMAIVFGMFAWTRLLNQGKQLKEDNDLFI